MNYRSIIPLAAALLCALFPASVLHAQPGGASTLKFTETVWDFGRIRETDGPVSHTFEFTNTGQNAIVIEAVNVSCGCTIPKYSREAVQPGKKGKITVTYDPDLRPGYFSKDVYVISNNGKNNDKLVIRGDVEGRPRTVEQDYPYLFDESLRLGSLSANMRYVPQEAPVKTNIGYANVAKKSVRVGFDVVPDDGIVSVEPSGEICAGCRGEFVVTAAVPKGHYGRLSYRIFPVIDGRRQKLGISVTGIATDNFSNLRSGEGPRADFQAAYHNLGAVKKGDKPSYTFKVTNDGNEPLVIRKIETQNNISSDLKEGTVIQAGKSLQIRCTLDTSTAQAGVFTQVVTLVMNDPTRPMRELRLAATVENR